MKKKERQNLIKKIVTENEISSQNELLKILRSYGECQTQATISRDMKDLRIVKSFSKEGEMRLLIINEDSKKDVGALFKSIQEYTISYERTSFIVTIHTFPNGADIIANYMDQIPMFQFIATMAGYDTLLIIAKTEDQAEKICHQLQEILSN
ncbi:arginine repressor [Candidatus Enterococcus myersii]|uniref:arginine repressor n=1 Tax=Candidatus Enterococcus myersii TaxID=2815322 RepID=UPI003241CE5E